MQTGFVRYLCFGVFILGIQAFGQESTSHQGAYAKPEKLLSKPVDSTLVLFDITRPSISADQEIWWVDPETRERRKISLDLKKTGREEVTFDGPFEKNGQFYFIQRVTDFDKHLSTKILVFSNTGELKNTLSYSLTTSQTIYGPLNVQDDGRIVAAVSGLFHEHPSKVSNQRGYRINASRLAYLKADEAPTFVSFPPARDSQSPSVRRPQQLPTGELVFELTSKTPGRDDDIRSELWLYDPKTQSQRQLTNWQGSVDIGGQRHETLGYDRDFVITREGQIVFTRMLKGPGSNFNSLFQLNPYEKNLATNVRKLNPEATHETEPKVTANGDLLYKSGYYWAEQRFVLHRTHDTTTFNLGPAQERSAEIHKSPQSANDFVLQIKDSNRGNPDLLPAKFTEFRASPELATRGAQNQDHFLGPKTATMAKAFVPPTPTAIASATSRPVAPLVVDPNNTVIKAGSVSTLQQSNNTKGKPVTVLQVDRPNVAPARQTVVNAPSNLKLLDVAPNGNALVSHPAPESTAQQFGEISGGRYRQLNVSGTTIASPSYMPDSNLIYSSRPTGKESAPSQIHSSNPTVSRIFKAPPSNVEYSDPLVLSSGDLVIRQTHRTENTSTLMHVASGRDHANPIQGFSNRVTSPAIAIDESTIAFNESDPSGQKNWTTVYNLATHDKRRFSSELELDQLRFVPWTPDQTLLQNWGSQLPESLYLLNRKSPLPTLSPARIRNGSL